MATLPTDIYRRRFPAEWLAALFSSRWAIGGARFDALLLWGSPIVALLFVYGWLGVARAFPPVTTHHLTSTLVVGSLLITYAHLFAVLPRAYLNREVFKANRLRLTLVPLLLIAGVMLSPMLFAAAVALGVFWDIHHTAMQNFGLSRIYDMKGGNDPQCLRGTDLRLNWMLYVGPLMAGAAFSYHVDSLRQLDRLGIGEIAQLPGLVEGHLRLFGAVAIAAWAVILLWAALDYRKAIARGYRMPAHKLALLISTSLVSIIAWGFSSPLVALASINIYHATQYFALVWLKEGERISQWAKIKPRLALDLFLGGCLLLGIFYQLAGQANMRWLLAPFIACSLLHFWFDGFVWSVRKRQV